MGSTERDTCADSSFIHEREFILTQQTKSEHTASQSSKAQPAMIELTTDGLALVGTKQIRPDAAWPFESVAAQVFWANGVTAEIVCEET
jgi:hypothetical protein